MWLIIRWYENRRQEHKTTQLSQGIYVQKQNVRQAVKWTICYRRNFVFTQTPSNEKLSLEFSGMRLRLKHG